MPEFIGVMMKRTYRTFCILCTLIVPFYLAGCTSDGVREPADANAAMVSAGGEQLRGD